MKHPLLIAGLTVLALYIYTKRKQIATDNSRILTVADYHIGPLAGNTVSNPSDNCGCDNPSAVVNTNPLAAIQPNRQTIMPVSDFDPFSNF